MPMMAIPPQASFSDPQSTASSDETDAAQQTMKLYAALAEADSLSVGAHRLAVALAAQGGFERVTIGLREQPTRGTRLVASSQLDLAQLPPEVEQLILGAMDEALEQGVTLSCGGTTEGTPIAVEQGLLERAAGGAVATVPLGIGGDGFAAVCVERRSTPSGPAFNPCELQRLEAQLVLAAPALRWLQAGTESWWRRARRDASKQWAALRQPDRRTTRRLIAAGVALLAFLTLVPLDDHVAGRARIEGAEQRVLAAPTDGFVKTAHVRPGDRVRAGAALVDLVDADLRLERERWASQLAQHENAYAAAMARSDRVASATSIARVSEAQAQLALVDQQLARGRITAPFDAQVIQGDLSQSIGAPVRQGDTLLTLATTGRHRVIIEVDEVDIGRVAPRQHGQLALSSLPWDHDELVVDRIAPMARAVDGRNVFEVEARLVEPRNDLRPGLLGRAELVSGRAPLLWAWSRHALLRLRVALWTWLG
ncbi:MAG: HlyD family efflux transporter periplasmic adaptor subunit [Burkholderiaceae bacterium]